MANVNDTLGVAGHVERERNAVSEARIEDEDKKAILEFADHREVNEGVAPTTLRDDIGNLRRSAERAEKPLLGFESIKDVNQFLKRNGAEHSVSEPSNDNYRKALRLFFEWADDDPDYPAFEWWEEIHIPTRDPDPLDPAEVLSLEEVRELRRAADHAREKALIEFLADSGMRISAACQLRRGDIRGLDGNSPTFRVNPQGRSQKGMKAVPRPIIKSTIWLRKYLNEFHPDDHADAPVFAVRDYAEREREDGAISNSGVSNILKRTAERAGIDRDRVHPHAFRHVAVTRMKRDLDLDWDDIAHMTGWSDKSISRMKGVYAHLTTEEKNERIWNAATDASGGVEPEPGGEPEHVDCHNCGREIEARWSVCPECEARQDGRAEPTVPLSDVDEWMARSLLPMAQAIEQVEDELGVDLGLSEHQDALAALRARNVELGEPIKEGDG